MKWAVRLKRAQKRGGFTQLDLVAAGSWITCAVGEVRATHRGKLVGAYWRKPVLWLYSYSPGLADLGEAFYLAVSQDKPTEVVRAYNKIQRWTSKSKCCSQYNP